MKTIKFLFGFFGCLLMFFMLIACNNNENNSSNNNESNKQDGEITTPNDSDTLVIFFSRAGENYMVGDYGNGYAGYVDVGNTEVVVNYILDEYHFDSFKINPVVPYPDSYSDMLNVAREEQQTNARPEFIGEIENFENYQNFIIGYPIWNNTFPNIIISIFDKYDFSHKNLYPFSTHGGSGLGNTLSKIKELEPNATIVDSFSIPGANVRSDSGKSQVLNWIDSLNLKKGEIKEMKNVFINEVDNLNQIELAVLDSYMKICQAMIDKDSYTLRKYMNANVEMRHMTGVVQTLDEWINDILNGELNYYNITLSNIEIEINQNSALLSADSILDAAVYGGSGNDWNMHIAMNFLLIDNVWIRI